MNYGVLRLLTFFLLAIVTASSSIARDIPDLLQLIDGVNSQDLTVGDTKPSCLDCSLPAELEACAVALCGAPEVQPLTFVYDSDIDKVSIPDVKKRFSRVEPIISEVVRTEQNIANEYVRAVNKKIEEAGGQIKVGNFYDYELDKIAEVVFQNNYLLTVDVTKPIEERISFDALYIDKKSKTFKMGLESYLHQKKKSILAKNYEAIFSGVYTEEEAKVIVDNEIAELKKLYQEFIKQGQNSQSDFLQDLLILLNEYGEGAPLDIRKLGNLSSRVGYFVDLIRYELTGETSSQVRVCSEPACKNSINELVTKSSLLEQINKLKVLANSPTLETSLISRCHSSAATSALLDYDRQQYQKVLPEIMTRLDENFFKLLSQKSSADLKTFLKEKLSISSGTNNPDLELDKFISYIERDFEQYKDFSQYDNNDFSSQSLGELVASLFSRYYKHGTVELPYPFWNCRAGGSLIWDSFSTWKSAEGIHPIAVSMFTNMHLNNSASIIAHEFGHAISYAVKNSSISNESLKSFTDMRQCLQEDYLRIDNSTAGIWAKEGQFIEEDFADLVSFITFKDMNHRWCWMLDVSEDKHQYLDLSLEPQLQNQDHSQNLLRILRQYVHKKLELPPACQKVVDAHKKNYRFQSCIK